jgi:membrane protein YqaA with SNARE-associated domain
MNTDEIITIVQAAFANPIFIKYGFYGLFATSFLSATALPFPSELTAFALISGGDDKLPVALIMAAGWTAGGFLGYYLGRSGNKLFNFLKGKPKKEGDESKTHGLLEKFGWIAIFGSAWIPFIGDFIPIVAGTKKYDIRLFGASLAAGKVVKALVVVYFGSFIFGKLFGG